MAGKAVRSLGRIPSAPGDNVVLTIDSALQEAAWKALGDRPGALAALDPRNGAVLALVSSPSFDPNLFNGGHLLRRLGKAGQRPPASHGKPGDLRTVPPGIHLQADHRRRRPRRRADHPGDDLLLQRQLSTWAIGCFAAGRKRVTAMSTCTGRSWSPATSISTTWGKLLGVDRIAAYARAFGLGAPLGIDLTREKSGLIPTKAVEAVPLQGTLAAGRNDLHLHRPGVQPRHAAPTRQRLCDPGQRRHPLSAPARKTA